MLNNRPQILPVAPTVINGRTMVPLRFISEVLNADVDYLHEHQLVLITSEKFRLNSNSLEMNLTKEIDKYKIYKKLTMTNENSIALYRKNKDQLLVQISRINLYLESVGGIASNNAEIIQEADKNIDKFDELIHEVEPLVTSLKKDSLTNQLGNEIQSYYNILRYTYKLLDDEKKITDLSIEKYEQSKQAKQRVVNSVNQIEKEIQADILNGRKGIS